ncbi:MAG: XdhC family protein, partial [Chloroflexota bacterium]|nr:XdhC family protein [Chloroflexota bacterium]
MEILELLKKAVAEEKPVALCTVVNTKGAVPRHAGAKMIVFGDGRTAGTVGGGEVESLVLEEALNAIKDGKTRFLNYDLIDVEKGDPGLCGGTLSIFVEPYLNPATVVIIGAGHVGRAVAHLASWLGFRVVISDDRQDLCTPEKVPGGDIYLPVSISELPDEITIDSQTYMVLVTRGV